MKVGNSLLVKLKIRGTLNLADNVDVAENGLTDKLRLGAVGFIDDLVNRITH